MMAACLVRWLFVGCRRVTLETLLLLLTGGGGDEREMGERRGRERGGWGLGLVLGGIPQIPVVSLSSSEEIRGNFLTTSVFVLLN